MDRSDLISLLIGYIGCLLMTWIGIWTLNNPTARAFPFDINGFVTHFGGLR